MTDLRARLLALQTTENLWRKAKKAMCLKSKQWTQEEIDYAKRQGQEWEQDFKKMEVEKGNEPH